MKTRYASMKKELPTEPGLYWGGPIAKEAVLVRITRRGKGFRYWLESNPRATYKKADVAEWVWSTRLLEPNREKVA